MIAWGALALGILGFVMALSIGGSRGAPSGIWAMFLFMAIVAGIILLRRHRNLVGVIQFRTIGTLGPTRYSKYIWLGLAGIGVILVIVMLVSSQTRNGVQTASIAPRPPTQQAVSRYASDPHCESYEVDPATGYMVLPPETECNIPTGVRETYIVQEVAIFYISAGGNCPITDWPQGEEIDVSYPDGTGGTTVVRLLSTNRMRITFEAREADRC